MRIDFTKQESWKDENSQPPTRNIALEIVAERDLVGVSKMQNGRQGYFKTDDTSLKIFLGSRFAS